MQDCTAKYQSGDMHMKTSAKSIAKGCTEPTGIGERHMFGKCGTNLNFMGSELLADPEPFG